jgi:hypothetical protein
MLTETQAKTKWCPHARIGVSASQGGPASINDPRCEPEHRANCIASECAMWRWIPTNDTVYVGSAPVQLENGRFELRPQYAQVPPSQGFCGLAGRPEVAS